MAVADADRTHNVEPEPTWPTVPSGVWDLPTRLFHWGLAGSVIAAWLSGGSGARLHETIGYTVVGLVVFRILWGLVGTRHARFKDFVRPPRQVYAYVLALTRLRAPHYVGHNPAGGLMILLLIGILVTLSATGMMMQSDAFFGIMWVETTHTVSANSLLVLIPLHVIGVVVSSVLHRENLVTAMITGNKRLPAGRVGDSTIERERRLLEKVRGAEGLVALVVAVGLATGYGWYSTSGRTAVVVKESQPPHETAKPSLAALQVTQSIRDSVPEGVRQDYVASGPTEASRAWLISSGGRLYDNWWKALGTEAPKTRHPAWPASNVEVAVADTWRCKSCHGWDYKGSGGQNASGPGKTGIKGIQRMQRRLPEEILTILTNKTHRFDDTVLPLHARYRLALFVSEGQHSVDNSIARNGKATSPPQEGRALFQSMCAACHGFDGRARRLGKSSDPQYQGVPKFVGAKARANAVEVLHKIRNGHPGATMISLRPLPFSYAAKVLAYTQTLPAD